MVRVVNIREDVLVTLSVVSDMAYAWEVLRTRARTRARARSRARTRTRTRT
jgi:hypothetical protein